MKTMDQTLPAELLYEPDGHLTETALTCVADGELDILPNGVLAHLDECDACSHRLGEAALLSMAAGEALLAASAPLAVPAAVVELAPASPPRRARRPLPVAAIVAALLLALVTAGPALLDLVGGAPGTIAGVVNSVPFLLRVGAAFVRAPWATGSVALFVKLASAVAMAAIGLQVARTAARSGSWQQGGV